MSLQFQDTSFDYVYRAEGADTWDRDYEHADKPDDDIAIGVFAWPLLSLIAIIGASLLAVVL